MPHACHRSGDHRQQSLTNNGSPHRSPMTPPLRTRGNHRTPHNPTSHIICRRQRHNKGQRHHQGISPNINKTQRVDMPEREKIPDLREETKRRLELEGKVKPTYRQKLDQCKMYQPTRYYCEQGMGKIIPAGCHQPVIGTSHQPPIST